MKKFKKKLLLSLLLCISFFSISYIMVKADSGWDSDYDSGGFDSGGFDSGGYSGGYDWDSSSSGSSSYDSNGDSDFGISVVIFIIIVVIVISVSMKSKNNVNNKNYQLYTNLDDIIKNTKCVDEMLIKEKIKDFNKKEFLDNAYKMFIDIQNAWSDFDYSKLQSMLSDELFNTYKSQLKTLSLKKQKNVMNNFNKDYIEITDFNVNKEKSTIKVILLVSFYDYVVDKDNKVVRGTSKNKVKNVYELTFIKSDKKVTTNCPSCGAPLGDKPADTCPYCNCKIVLNSYDWILSKKERKSGYSGGKDND